MRRSIEWPDKARIVVIPTLNFESWLKGMVAPPLFPGVAGKADAITENWVEYGGRVGIWRFMDICDKYGIKSPVHINALCAERYPDAVKELVRRGHELVGHGYAQDIFMDSLSREEQREIIRKVVSIFEDVTGQRPYGWVGPAAKSNTDTLEILAEEGFLYHGDYANDDLPYLVSVKGKTMVIIPYQFEINDYMVYSMYGMSHGSFYNMFKEAFDYLYWVEGESSPKMLMCGVHAQVFGRPLGASIFERCLKYAKSFPKVWFARKIDIAKWYLDHYSE